MFNLTGSEIIVILLLALVVLGPEKLPDAIRKFSQTYGELKRMGTGFQSEIKSALDEPMREMRQTADLIQRSVDPKQIVAQAEAEERLAQKGTTGDAPDVAAAAPSTPSKPTEPSPRKPSDPFSFKNTSVSPRPINSVAQSMARGPVASSAGDTDESTPAGSSAADEASADAAPRSGDEVDETAQHDAHDDDVADQNAQGSESESETVSVADDSVETA